MNKENRNRFIDTENKLRFAIEEGEGRWVEKEKGIKKYKLSVIKQVTGM